MKKIMLCLGVVVLSSCASQQKSTERNPNQAPTVPVLTCDFTLNKGHTLSFKEVITSLPVKTEKKSDKVGEVDVKNLFERFEILAIAARSGFDENDFYYSLQLKDNLIGITSFDSNETYYTPRHTNTGFSYSSTLFYGDFQGNNKTKPVKVDGKEVPLRSVTLSCNVIKK